MAYPYGHYNDTIVEIAKNCGIAYSRTTEVTNGFGLPTDWLRLKATCKHTSPRLDELSDKFLNQKVTTRPLLFYLWGHSFEFEQDNNWNVIENFAKKMGHRDDIWYATNIEIYDYIEAFRSLRFTADGGAVYNPTCIPLYVSVYKEKDIIIQPGQYVTL